MSSEDNTSSTPATLHLPGAPPSENANMRNTKERVRDQLKDEFKLREEELPEDRDKECSYYDGAALNLPSGWLIEQRPRPCGKLDQFFYEPETGKQFRSLTKVWKHVQPISSHTNVVEPANKVPYPWAQMKNKNKRKRGVRSEPKPQPEPELEPFDYNNRPDFVTWRLEDVEDDVWLPEVDNAEQYKLQWEKAFDALTPNPTTYFNKVFSTSGSECESEEEDNGKSK